MCFPFLNVCFHFSDMVESTDAWTEHINFENLSNLFDSFNIVIPEDPFQMSFTMNLLDTTKLDAFVSEIRLLARRIVLCKHIKDEDKKLGTVYVYEVSVNHKENQMVIEEMVNKYISTVTLYLPFHKYILDVCTISFIHR